MATYIITNQPGEIDFEAKGAAARTVRNAQNLLLTQMGEVPYDRMRGFDPALYHQPMGKLRERLLPELDRVMLWEPDAEVVRAEASLLESGEILIRAEIEISGG